MDHPVHVLPPALVHRGDPERPDLLQPSNSQQPPRRQNPCVEGDRRQIVAFGGGGFSMEGGNPLLDDYVAALTGAVRPRVCFLPTASGDADHYIVRFYRAFGADRFEASHISLFRREQGAARTSAPTCSPRT